jgi:glutathione S-transferase
MLLRSTLTSPFGRKVTMAALRLGLNDRIKVENADVSNPADPIRRDNPLGKMPVMILDDGRCLHDSRVILEYIDHLGGGGKIIPKEEKKRFAALTLQSLADGISDAALLIVYEARYRPPELRHEPWVSYQREKIERALAALRKDRPDPADFTVGTLALSAALGYLDWRKQVDWRKTTPELITWLDAFRAKAPEYDATHAEG